MEVARQSELDERAARKRLPVVRLTRMLTSAAGFGGWLRSERMYIPSCPEIEELGRCAVYDGLKLDFAI